MKIKTKWILLSIGTFLLGFALGMITYKMLM